MLTRLGERIKLARLRRGLSGESVSQRSNIFKVTLHRAEKGNSAITLGTYVRIFAALQLQGDFELLAKDDELGRRLQDLKLPHRGINDE
ncbi:helix-turn-helix domain-containing protein [Ferrovum sp. PN-J185]|uniref:helix-turn-helix domain-containing protein n=1 Tax=Ferrovum sp. PN-J185 TaxID=1356306 RepID=UPI002D1FB56C|nr:helix-turn-helix transcriptional regulator [Ferrovum sp. PN-J185]MCC6068837.1 helix-turn-helix domain-containing protein [Ferrovum sp. PN-J185]